VCACVCLRACLSVCVFGCVYVCVCVNDKKMRLCVWIDMCVFKYVFLLWFLVL